MRYDTSVDRAEPNRRSILNHSSCANAVPTTASTATQPSAFQLGTCDGACATPNGSSTTSAPSSAVVDSTGPVTSATRCCPYSADTPYEREASETAPTPATPHHPL